MSSIWAQAFNKKRAALEKDLDDEISATENELSEFKKSSGEKVTKIAAETSAELIKELIGEGVNNSSIAAIVEDQAKINKERKDVIWRNILGSYIVFYICWPVGIF